MTSLRRFTCLTLIAAGLLALAPRPAASTIASDTFEGYPTGSVVGQNGGTGWLGAWLDGTTANRPTNFIADTLLDPMRFTPVGGQAIQGGSRALEVGYGSANAITAARQLAVPLSDTFYVGYLLREVSGTWTGANNTFGLHLSDSATSTANLNFGIRNSTGTTDPSFTNHFFLRNGTGSPPADAATGGLLQPGTDYYLVARVSKVGTNGLPTTTYDRIELWLNPGVDSLTALPSGNARLQLTTPGLSSVSFVSVRGAVLQTDDLVRIDQLLIGTSWSDVVPVPEPATLGLLGLGGLVLLLRRRR